MVRRGPDGGISPHGRVYGCPFRWGSTVVAFRKDLLLHYGGHGIRDWADLLQPKLRGRVAFMDSSREFVGIALKSLGLSLNTRASDLQRHGLTLQQVKDRVQAFRQQARLFSDRESGRALGAGDVWAMVGSSGDVLPLAERMQSVAVVVPVSGTALWADVWVVPRGAKGGSNMAGPSPLLPSWLEFTTMPARIGTIPGLKEGASPLLLPDLEISEPLHNIDEEGEWEGMVLAKGNGYLPASTVLARSEFLCPLDQDTVALYHQLLSNS